MPSNDQVALIDLDGTSADFDRAMNAQMARLRGPEEKETWDGRWDDLPPHIEARRSLIKKLPGFWRTLPRIEAGFLIIQAIRETGFQLNILTQGPQKTHSAWSEKVEWAAENIPDAHVTITRNKSLTYGRVLFDDYPDYYRPWLEQHPRGLVLALAHPYNDHPPHPQILRFDGHNLDPIRRALNLAFHRAPKEIINYQEA